LVFSVFGNGHPDGCFLRPWMSAQQASPMTSSGARPTNAAKALLHRRMMPWGSTKQSASGIASKALCQPAPTPTREGFADLSSTDARLTAAAFRGARFARALLDGPPLRAFT